MLGLVPDPLSNDDGKFRKWVFNPQDKNFMNRYHSDEIEKQLKYDEKPITTDDIYFYVSKDVEEYFRTILHKQAQLWLGKLCEINVADIHIDLVPDVAHTPRV